jgi:hypothetical protein
MPILRQNYTANTIFYLPHEIKFVECAIFAFFVRCFREFSVLKIGFSRNSKKLSLDPSLMCAGQVVEMLVNASQSRLETSSSSNNKTEIKPQTSYTKKIYTLTYFMSYTVQHKKMRLQSSPPSSTTAMTGSNHHV